MIEVISDRSEYVSFDESNSLLKEREKITLKNRTEWLKTKPSWFRYIMNIKAKKEPQEIAEYKITGEL